MEGASPNLEKLYEQKYNKKMSKSLLMLLGLYKPRDRQLVGLMNKAVIPIQLVQAKNWYQHRIKNAKSDRFRAIMKSIYVSMISPLVDAFMPYPVPIDTLMKDYATDQGEIEVVGTPKLPKKLKKKKESDEEIENFWDQYADEDFEEEAEEEFEGAAIDEEERERQKLADIAKLEENLRGDAGESFEGPFEEKSGKSPFLSFRRASDEDDSE